MLALVRRSWSFARLLAIVVLVAASPLAFAQKLALPAETVAPGKPTPLAAPGQPASMAPIAGANSATPPVPSMGVDAFAEQAGPETMLSPPSGGRPFDPAAGNHIRATYRSETYGQQDGNLNLGTMKLWQAGDGFGFVDGQVTLNEQAGTGYNLGLGYRWMTLPLFPNSPDSAKIAGLSVWTDGTSVEGENFFPQVGVSLEYLGDRLDFRSNVYVPLGDDEKTRDFAETGSLVYTGNFIANGIAGWRDTALTVVDAELAGRIQNLDAWVFGGVYGMSGGEFDEVGGKVGLRGYATPDMLVSVMITNDEIFDTNAVFGATWFIGRTRRENCPSGTLRDRFREPVFRNDYVATAQTRVQTMGSNVTNGAGEAIRIVHVDSTAAAGGDGTFERPLNTLDTVNANSQTGDIVLAHAGSTLGGTTTLQNNQRLLGEGGGRTFTVSTSNGSRTLPETISGALNGVVPVLTGVAGQDTVTLASSNSVENLTFTGGRSAIVSTSANNSSNVTVDRVTVSGTTGPGAIRFDGTTTTNNSNTLNAVTVTNSTVRNATGPAFDVANTTGVVTIGATNTVQDVTGNAIRVSGNNGSVTVGAEVTTASTVTGGGVLVDNNGGTVNVNGNVTANNMTAVTVQNARAAVNFGSSGSITNNGTGNAVTVTDSGDLTTDLGNVAFNGAVRNNGAGQAVSINMNGGNDDVVFNTTAAVTDNGTDNLAGNESISVDNLGSGSEVTFNGQTTVTALGAARGVSLNNNNTGSTVTFGNLDVTTDSGTAFASNSGQVVVTAAGSTIRTVTGRAIDLTGGGSTTAGVGFASVNTGNTTTDAVADSINLANFNGTVTVNDGVLKTSGRAVNVNDASLSLNSVDLNASGTTAVTGTFGGTAARTVNIRNADLNVRNVAGGGAVDVTSTGTGGATLEMTDITDVGAVNVNETGAGNATATLRNVQGAAGATFASSGAGTASLTVDGSTFSGGDITYTAVNTGTSQADITGTTLLSGSVVGSVNNNSTTSVFNVLGSSITSVDNDAAVDLTFGSSLSDVDVDISNNLTLATGDDEAVDLNFNGGDVEFRLNNNAATNTSFLATANVEVTGTATLDATITNNQVTNSGVGSVLETSASSGTATLNVQLSNNTRLAGAGSNILTRAAGTTVNVFELNDTFNNTGNRNTPGVTFNPNNVGSFSNLNSLPQTPGGSN